MIWCLSGICVAFNLTETLVLLKYILSVTGVEVIFISVLYLEAKSLRIGISQIEVSFQPVTVVWEPYTLGHESSHSFFFCV